MPLTLPTAADADVEYEDYYESTLSQPLGVSDTDIYPVDMPQSTTSFIVIDPDGDVPEICFFNSVGADYLRCPSATNGEGRGVFQTEPTDWESGTKIGMYTVAAFFEGIVTGRFLRDGFLQPRHFSSSLDPAQWTGAGENFVFGSNQGQKVSTYVVTGDKRTKYPAGTKLKMPRVGSVGTQCTDLESSSSQYWSKSSPSGLGWTDDFSAEAWIKAESYGSMGIVARRNGDTEGWAFAINGNGQIQLVGLRIASNNRSVTSSRSVPLNEWIHVAATLDMSGAAGVVYMNGISVASTVSTTGTATALVQGTSALVVGALKSDGSNPFDGKIGGEVRVWSSVRTAQQIKDNMNKTLVGNETNLAVCIEFNGNATDKTANANTPTASGSATATDTDHPFSSTEYGIVLDATYSAGSTTLSVFSGNTKVCPSEDLTNVSYSAMQTPSGFPAADYKWELRSIYRVFSEQISPSAGTWYHPGNCQIGLPIGEWDYGYEVGQYGGYRLTNTSAAVAITLSIANNSESDRDLSCRSEIEGASSTIAIRSSASKTKGISIGSFTTFYLNLSSTANLNSIQFGGDYGGIILKAKCAYV